MTPKDIAREAAKAASALPLITDISLETTRMSGADVRDLVRGTIDEMNSAGIAIRAIRVDSQFGGAVGGDPIMIGALPSGNSKSIRGVIIISDPSLRDRVEIGLSRGAAMP